MEKNTLISELTQGKELTEQLKNHLNPASSLQTRRFLIEKILSSYEKALSLVNWGANFDVQHKPNFCISESLHPIPNNSPRSDTSHQDCKNQAPNKKRKTQQKWTEQVKVCSGGTGLEGPVDDGYSWRKYGQKDILGANFPRGYYRCTHRPSQGCLAIKQVQRSDENPSIFEVTYRGRHTCVQASHHLSMASVSNENSKQNQEDHQQMQRKKPRYEEKKSIPRTDALEQGLVVKTEKLERIFPSFSFREASIDKQNQNNNNNNYMGSLSPTLISPAASESNYFSASSCQFDNFEMCYAHNVQTPESQLTEIGSLPTSVTNSPIEDFDFSNLDFETNFQFGNFELEFLA